MKVFEPWVGELGWELMSWQAYCRKVSREYDYTIVTSYKGMGALYKDFATEYLEHDKTKRELTFPNKVYKVKGEFIRFGSPNNVKDILIHARGIKQGIRKNYKHWNCFKGLDAGWIGLSDDYCYGTDLRNMPLQTLMDAIAGAKVVIGQSSGIMHLAQLCGTPIIVWGDNNTYFGDTLEKRYRETWNPLKSEVHWIDCNDWQPNPNKVMNELRSIL